MIFFVLFCPLYAISDLVTTTQPFRFILYVSQKKSLIINGKQAPVNLESESYVKLCPKVGFLFKNQIRVVELMSERLSEEERRFCYLRLLMQNKY